ncbi:MAG: MMPL family transporter, partial [Actinomycetota bacterium]|nr:MMPL family transporter [Actinomycetota bacterium]
MSQANEPTKPKARHRLVELGMSRPRAVLWASALLAVIFGAATAFVSVDTDPENMLSASDPVRVRNAEMRDTFGADQRIVVGLVDPRTALTPRILRAADALRREIERLDGVEGDQVLSFASAAGGQIEVADRGDVARIVSAVEANPVLAGNVLSSDGTAVAIFVPLEAKDEANQVAAAIERTIADDRTLAGLDSYIAGLPLAEEAFGSEMFTQMAIFAPLAGLLVFALMLLFFRSLILVAAGMAVAMLSVIWTMGLLIATGNTLHIMSSMIPIFLMPIAILDSVHVLSEFFDRYPALRDRRAALRAVYGELFRPLTFTSLTTAVAFASLAIAPIPPVRVFGAFVAVGVFLAWLLTLVFIPAYVVSISERRLQRTLGARSQSGARLSGWLQRLCGLVVRRRVAIVVAFAALALAAVPGITSITVNDNPVRWFKSGSDVRVATEELNARLPGTFSANLLLEAERPGVLTAPATVRAVKALDVALESEAVVGTATSYAELPPSTLGAGARDERALADPLITRDGRRANVRLQLSDGDNQAMRGVVDSVEGHLESRPLPDGVSVAWAGETYLNLVWQDKMVSGMLKAFLATLAVVLALMVVLFRSLRWAILAIVPVVWTLLLVYGVLGYAGKDYDMPIAVLSTLVLGIGVDFAIHFVQRFREMLADRGSSRAALRAFFEEPSRALTRNALVIAIGFT